MNLTLMQRTKDLDTTELLEQLPAFQQLLFRVINCQVSVQSAYRLAAIITIQSGALIK